MRGLVPESDIEEFRNGCAKAIDVARKWGVSRQAVYAKASYRPKGPGIQQKRWEALFLYRIGMTFDDIAEMTGYKSGDYVRFVLATVWRLRPREVWHVPRVVKATNVRRWEALFLMRIGFTDKDIASMTGYKAGTVSVYRCRMMRRGLLL